MRDIQCRAEDALVATVGLDKMLKICDLRTNSCVLSFSCGSPQWSTCWKADDEYTLFSGSAQGTVQIFDMRNTQQHVSCLSELGSSPVHSLSYLTKYQQLMVGNLEGVKACTLSGADQEASTESLPVHGWWRALDPWSLPFLFWIARA